MALKSKATAELHILHLPLFPVAVILGMLQPQTMLPIQPIQAVALSILPFVVEESWE